MDKQCSHQFTFTKDDLFAMNSILSKKKCEKCGETIVLDRKYKTYVLMFILLLVIVLVLLPMALKSVFVDVSYMAKGMLAVLAFVLVYAYGILKIMKKATYKRWEPPKRVGEDAYEETKARTTARLMKLYGRNKDLIKD